MSGNYPDVPGHRFAIDLDGTIVLVNSALVGLTEVSDQGRTYLCDEGRQGIFWSTAGLDAADVYILFPEKRDISGMFLAQAIIAPSQSNSGVSPTVWTSANSTNGIDGDWTNAGTVSQGGGPFTGDTSVPCISEDGSTLLSNSFLCPFTMRPYYRQILHVGKVNGTNYNLGYQLLSGPAWVGVRALHLQFSNPAYSTSFQDCCVSAIQIYGARSAGQSLTRLVFWDPSSDVELTGAALDMGDVAFSTTTDRHFRLKNISPTSTATGITLSLDCPADTSPSLLTQYAISVDGGTTFTTTGHINDLGPGGVSGDLILRRTTPADATTNTWTARVNALVGAWT